MARRRSNGEGTIYKNKSRGGFEGQITVGLRPDGRPIRRKASGGISHAAVHVSDILPTVLEATGVNRPRTHHGRELLPLDGESFLPLLDERSWERQQPIFFEHEGNSAVRIGNFKLVREFNRSWELYDIVGDRTELNDLAGSDRRRVESMQASYDDWASRTGVQDWNRLLPKLQEIWEMSDVAQT